MATLRFKGFEVPIVPGQTVLDVLLDARAPVNFLCMGGTCGTCRVRVVAGGEHLEAPGDGERERRLNPGERLACQALLTGLGDVGVEQD